MASAPCRARMSRRREPTRVNASSHGISWKRPSSPRRTGRRSRSGSWCTSAMAIPLGQTKPCEWGSFSSGRTATMRLASTSNSRPQLASHRLQLRRTVVAMPVPPGAASSRFGPPGARDGDAKSEAQERADASRLAQARGRRAVDLLGAYPPFARPRDGAPDHVVERLETLATVGAGATGVGGKQRVAARALAAPHGEPVRVHEDVQTSLLERDEGGFEADDPVVEDLGHPLLFRLPLGPPGDVERLA